MTSVCDARDYYKRMLELQSKLRKSEEERIRLEERFNLLAQESRNRHDTCISRLRMRYIEFLEEQRIRDERNHKLLGTLDRVDNSLSLIAAKTEKLNVLRKQYENYLLQTYANPQNSGSVGDSGIVSQVDEGYFKKNSPVVQFSHRVNQNISLPMIPYHTKDNSWKDEHRLHMQNLPRTRFTPLPTTLHQKINISRTGPAYERKLNSLKIIQNVNQHSPTPQIPSSQIYQPGQDIYNNVVTSSANLQVNRCLQAQYLPMPNLKNTALNESLLSQYNKLTTTHMEPIQKNTSFATNGVSTTESILRRKPSNMRQNHIASTFPQHPSNVPITQHTLYHNTGIPQNFQRSNIRDLLSPSTLGSVPIKIVKADSPRGVPVEMFPKTQRQMDYATSYKPYGYSFNSLRPKEISTHFLPRESTLHSNVPNLGSFSVPRKKSGLDEECRTTRLLENELDRYIDKIRNLHRELDVQSLEEHDYEQNTSGDLLNITLSDDGTDYPLNKAKDESIPQDVAKILALADNLASKKPPIEETRLSCNDKENDENAEDRNIKSDTRFDVLSDQIDETSTQLEEKMVNDNVAFVNLELEQLDENNSNLEKQKRSRKEVKYMEYSNENEKTIPPESTDTRHRSGDAVMQNTNEFTQEDYVSQKAEELEISQEFSDVELLSPWDIKDVAKEVLEVRSSEPGANLAQNDQYNVIAITAENEDEKKVPNNSVVLGHAPEHVINEQIDTIKQQDTNEDLEIPLNSENFNQENKEQEAIQDNHPDDGNFEYTDLHYENEIENVAVEPIHVQVENNQMPEVQNRLETEFFLNEQRPQELDEDNVYTSDTNQEFVDPNQQYDYNQIALGKNANNEEYQQYANNDYVSTDETAAKTQDEYFQRECEEYPAEPTQEYVEGNQEYYDDKDGSNVYDENYETDQIQDDRANSEYLQEQYNTAEADQVATNMESDQNIVNIEAHDVAGDLPINEIDEDPTNPNNENSSHQQESVEQTNQSKKKKDVINSLLDSDTESTIERNVSNTESDFDFQ